MSATPALKKYSGKTLPQTVRPIVEALPEGLNLTQFAVSRLHHSLHFRPLALVNHHEIAITKDAKRPHYTLLAWEHRAFGAIKWKTWQNISDNAVNVAHATSLKGLRKAITSAAAALQKKAALADASSDARRSLNDPAVFR